MRISTIILLACSLHLPAYANPADIFGVGARAMGMGGATTAKPTDTSASYYNPAAITSFHADRFDIGYSFGKPNLKVNGNDVGIDTHRGLNIGVASPGKIGSVPFGIGVSLFVPDQHMSRTRSLSVGQPRFMYYNNRPQRMFLSLNLGFQIMEGLRIGGGLSYLTKTRGTVILDGNVNPSPELSHLQTEMDVDLVPGNYGQIGIQYEPTDKLAFGLVYRTTFNVELEQRFIIRGDIGAAGLPPIVEDAYFELNSLGRDLYHPGQLTFGAFYQVTPALSISADIGWHQWSSFETPATRIEIELDVGPLTEDFEIPDPPPIPDANFKDIIVPRIGVEWKVRDDDKLGITARGGYVFEPSPVPAQTGETNFIDNTKHIFSIGGGITLPHLGEVVPLPMDINAGLSFAYLPSRTTIKDSPTDTIGSYSHSGNVIAASLTTSWRF